jgi:hypothetical protein
MHKVIQLISNFVYNKNMPLYMIKNQIIQKFQNLGILKQRATRQRIHFKNHLINKKMLIGSKCVALDVGHMCMK